MSAFYGPADREESIRTLNRAIDLGCTFWDTADMYGCGENEKLLAEVLRSRRSEVFLCTKFGNTFDGEGPDGKMTFQVNNKPEYIRKCIDDSLRRLGVDYIDLYYVHRINNDSSPIEETVATMAELVKEGKVRYIGLSEASASSLRRAAAIHSIAANQIEFSPWTLDIETNDVLKVHRELGIATVTYSPLGRGFLAGKFKTLDEIPEGDARRSGWYPRFSADNWDANMKLADAIKELAAKKGATAGQYVLAWVLYQGQDFIPIPGTTKVSRLEENLKAASIDFTDDDEKAVRKAIEENTVAGTRYPEQLAKLSKQQ